MNYCTYVNYVPFCLFLSRMNASGSQCVHPLQPTAYFGKLSFSQTNSCSGGLGVGLFIAKQIVVAHEGSLSVDSEKGKGALLGLTLPLLRLNSSNFTKLSASL